MGKCSTKSQLHFIRRAPSTEPHFVHHEAENEGESLSRTWKYSTFLYQSKTHSANASCFPHYFLVKTRRITPNVSFLKSFFSSLFQVKFKFSGFELQFLKTTLLSPFTWVSFCKYLCLDTVPGSAEAEEPGAPDLVRTSTGLGGGQH